MGTGLARQISDLLGPQRAIPAMRFFESVKRQLKNSTRILPAPSPVPVTAGARESELQPPAVAEVDVEAAEPTVSLNPDGLAHQPHIDALNISFLGAQREEIAQVLREWEATGKKLDKIDTLRRLMDVLPNPHLVNYSLGREEMALGRDQVYSLPAHICMDLASVCNIQCRFCKYTHHHVPKEFLPLEHIKGIEWYKYLMSLNLSAGTAESIIHPRFAQIFDYIRDTYPHLYILLLTNGRSLVEARLEQFRDRLNFLYVSMNASNREDYDHLIYKGDWDKFLSNMQAMKRVLYGTSHMTVQANFVMMRSNIDRALQNLEFAAEHGASLITFCHFYPHYIPDLHAGNEELLNAKFTYSDSLYFEQSKSDDVFAQVAQRATELGVKIQIPPPFGKPTRIQFGLRSLGEIVEDCAEPWQHLFLLWGWKSRREEATICCGLASDIGAFFERDEIQSLEGLRAFWNGPILRAYRRTANGDNTNPVCRLCREVDRFDPDGTYPDQADFFRFAGLDIPEHLQKPALATAGK